MAAGRSVRAARSCFSPLLHLNYPRFHSNRCLPEPVKKKRGFARTVLSCPSPAFPPSIETAEGGLCAKNGDNSKDQESYLPAINLAGLLFAFSTAAQQKSTGDDCGSEDPPNEPKQILRGENLEHKTIKLEEQLRVLTAHPIDFVHHAARTCLGRSLRCSGPSGVDLRGRGTFNAAVAARLKSRAKPEERYQRALMDSENVRRRTQKFVEDAKIFGIQSFCRDLVEVADILKTTLEIVVEDDDDPTLTLNKICEGLTLIEVKLQSIFTKHGLQKMNPIGGRYDPYDHEIICHVPAEDMQPGTVALVTVDGYKLHGRTIRHAHVGVAVESQECDEPAS